MEEMFIHPPLIEPKSMQPYVSVRFYIFKFTDLNIIIHNTQES